MWRTPSGIRVLRGIEARLFCAGLARLVERIDDSPGGCDTGVQAFDQLLGEQKVALLAYVASALLEETISAPPPAAICEAAIAAVYAQIESEVHGCAFDDPIPWTQMVLDCLVERGKIDDPPDFGFGEHEVWGALVDCLTDRVLRDRSWTMESEIADLPPGVARAAKRMMRIPHGYYMAIAPDPSEAELAAARARLQVLTCGEPDGGSLRQTPAMQPITTLILTSLVMLLYVRIVG